MGAPLAAALAVIRRIVGAAPILTIVLTLLGSGLGSGFVVAGAKDFWFEHVSKPQIQHDAAAAQLEADTTAFEAEAAKAKHERELELMRIADKWSVDAYEDTAWQQEQVNELLQEIDNYQRGVVDPDLRKKICGVTSSDLDFLGWGRAGRLSEKPARAHP